MTIHLGLVNPSIFDGVSRVAELDPVLATVSFTDIIWHKGAGGPGIFCLRDLGESQASKPRDYPGARFHMQRVHVAGSRNSISG
jgi:hypothetical protein